MNWDKFARDNGLTEKKDRKYWDKEEPSFYIEPQTNNIIFGFNCGKNKNINVENTEFKISEAQNYKYVKLYKKSKDVTPENCVKIFNNFKENIKVVCNSEFSTFCPTVDKSYQLKQVAELKKSQMKIQKAYSAIDWKGIKVPEGEFWKNADHNPWLNPTWHDKENFILKDDFNKIKDYNSKHSDDEQRIQTNILPQPYIGNPSAPIWILQINPSYSDVDIYDMVNIGEEIKEKIQKAKPEIKFNFINGNESDLLDKRRNLIEKQFSFEEPHFYILDECFKTISGDNGTSPQGGYSWWLHRLVGKKSAYLCDGDIKNAENFFVLESFPYHSKKSGSITKTLQDKVKHFVFWQKMIAYAIVNNKILIIMRKETRDKIESIFENLNEDHKDYILKGGSTNAAISFGNLIDGNGNQITPEKINRLLSSQRRDN